MQIKAATIDQYLSRHAESTASWILSSQLARTVAALDVVYQSAVIVPLFDEDSQAVTRLLAQITLKADLGRRLVVAVINYPSDAEPAQLARTQGSLRHLLQSSPTIRPLGDSFPLYLQEHQHNAAVRGIDLLIIDASSPGFCLGEGEGVGRARKMAADLALALYASGRLRSPMLGCTDGDAQLPSNYFELIERESEASGLLLPYVHELSLDPILDQGMAQLEATFRYYVLGLNHAASPYAYHSLGSAMAVSLPHYAAVRGFPNRKAGEDFYLLSKLVQLSSLWRVNCEPVRLLTRTSSRVPFGTGPRLGSWQAEGALTTDLILSYDPRVFVALKYLLLRLVGWAEQGSAAVAPHPDWLEKEAAQIFEKIQSSLVQCPTAQHRVARLHERFDALATLRFVRRLSMSHYPLIPLDQAIVRAGLLGHAPPIESSESRAFVLQQQLRLLESQLPKQVGPQTAVSSADFARQWPDEVGSLAGAEPK